MSNKHLENKWLCNKNGSPAGATRFFNWFVSQGVQHQAKHLLVLIQLLKQAQNKAAAGGTWKHSKTIRKQRVWENKTVSEISSPIKKLSGIMSNKRLENQGLGQHNLPEGTTRFFNLFVS